MDVNEKNCSDSIADRSSVVDESTSPAETESDENSTSPGPSTNDVKRKRRGSNEIFNWKLLKKNVTDLKNLAAGEGPENSGSSNSTVETQNSEDSGTESKENDTHVEKMDETVASTSDQPSREDASSSNSSSSSSSSSSTSLTSSSDADTMLSDCDDDNEMNNSDSPESPSLESPDSDADDDTFDVVSWNFGMQVPFDEDSNSSVEESTKDGNSSKLPKVLNKELPKEKFSFLNAISDRQIKGDDPKRRRNQRFDSKVYASRRMVQHLKLYKSLKKHNGCVNCVSFNHSGEILISGSDDKRVCLWDWSRSKSLLFYDSGHLANVFQAKFLPFSNDTKLITCGQDCQIRMSVLDQCGLHSTGLIVKHEKSVHKIALQPQMPNTFLSAGEDGIVYSIDIREPKPVCSKLLKMVRQRAFSTTCLYSIYCNPIKNYEFIVCGNDKNVRLFDQRKIGRENAPPLLTFCPNNLLTDESTGPRRYSKSVTCAMFNYNGSEILSSHNDNDIYLFDATTGKEVHRYDGHRNFATLKGVNFFGPRSEYIVSGSDCGYVYVWDKDSEAIVQWVKGDENIVNCLEPHPSFPVLATSGLDSDVKIWMPLSNAPANIRGLKEFTKVTKKNHYYKVNNFAHSPGRSLVVPLIIDPENMAFQETRSHLPVILRYRRTLRAVLQRRNQQRVRSSSDDDTPSDRDCDLPF